MAKEMKVKVVGRVLGLLLVLGLVAGGVTAGGLTERALADGAEKEVRPADSGVVDWSGGMFALARPAFAQSIPATGLTFLQKAGISAFTDVGREIDLVRARTVFRAIERQTDEYIIGSVALPGKIEWWDVHVFVHRDGWIIAYYHSERSTGLIINWAHRGKTNLEIALTEVTAAAGVPFVRVDFYDFRFPDARKLLVITDSDTFRIMIPHEFVVCNRAYSLRKDGPHWRPDSTLIIGGEVICRVDEGTTVGTISPGILPVGTYHTIERGGDVGRVAIILTYSEQ